jgi:hypothetical protein
VEDATEITGRRPAVSPHLQLIIWRDVFVLVDDGRAAAADYSRLGNLITEQAAKHPFGVAGLTVIPPNAQPPTPEAREAISNLLASLANKLRGACWLVEGGGFQGAMVRAVLTGLRLFGRYPYATHVSTQLTEALTWLLPQLADGNARLADLGKAADYITLQRARANV